MPQPPRKKADVSEPEAWRGRLRRFRFSRNVKQAALAADLGVTQAMVSRWESGLVDPSPAMQARIEKIIADDDAATPLVDWRSYTAAFPGLAAVISQTGMIETASRGLLALMDRTRDSVEGQALADVFRGDIPELHERLNSIGFFDESHESVESADKYCFVDKNGCDASCWVHGLHWPHRGEDGKVRWMLSGARIDEAEYRELRTILSGRIHPVSAR
jgi:transcriptional regulator with XRE-family HTH domain